MPHTKPSDDSLQIINSHFPHLNSTLAYIPEDIVMHSLYAKITFASILLFPDVYFVSYNNCVFIVSSVAFLCFNICVCHLLSNKEISSSNVYTVLCVTTEMLRQSYTVTTCETLTNAYPFFLHIFFTEKQVLKRDSLSFVHKMIL